MIVKIYTVCIRTQLGIYGQMYPFAFRSSIGLPLGTPSGEGIYLTVYPLSRLNTDTIFPCKIEIQHIIIITSEQYTVHSANRVAERTYWFVSKERGGDLFRLMLPTFHLSATLNTKYEFTSKQYRQHSAQCILRVE